ncbi:MAG: hypothetical protein WCY09_08765 [Candidatus Omnitrophota bacterium]
MISGELTNGVDKNEIRKRIRKGHMILFDTARAIDSLPDSDAKVEMISKHNTVLARLNELCNLVDDIDRGSCWYGFAITCPGCSCDMCPPLVTMVKENHIEYVDDFDRNREQKSREYYKNMGEPQ